MLHGETLSQGEKDLFYLLIHGLSILLKPALTLKSCCLGLLCAGITVYATIPGSSAVILCSSSASFFLSHHAHINFSLIKFLKTLF